MLNGVYDFCSLKNSEQIKIQFSFNPCTSVNWNYLFDWKSEIYGNLTYLLFTVYFFSLFFVVLWDFFLFKDPVFLLLLIGKSEVSLETRVADPDPNWIRIQEGKNDPQK